ncbi:solute carrier family 31 (copper transporter), member 1 [Geosmithia morbida]|uniref:Copper transport protein n=1 Tax=Geosmithia morbida TaxID=1094350 RepID=A0A9P4YQG8_9HYPO|nr:solute carrier family 31 (copper transporter), member 1 [Geosmithia morbida]KAF4120885.1 solute carrier family 31 (copper transporter), member 1 [Geosmithia morbida]
MDMDHGSSDCSVPMLWNWNTVGSCFISSSWQITSGGIMAATCIGVILLSMLVEASRRLGREYDDFLTRQFQRHAAIQGPRILAKSCESSSEPIRPVVAYRASFLQQAIRALLHSITFGGAYMVMLLVMYCNGYVIISIFIGTGLGKFLCDWLVVRIDVEALRPLACADGIGEATVCCG